MNASSFYRSGLAASLLLPLLAMSQSGLPVDLRGTFLSPKNDVVRCWTGGADTVQESSSGAVVVEGSLTPYSDSTRKPRAFSADLRGYRASFDIELGGTWNADRIRINLNSASSAAFEISRSGSTTQLQLLNSLTLNETTGASILHVEVSVLATGQCLAIATTVDGSSPGFAYVFPLTALPTYTGASMLGVEFFGGGQGSAQASISKFETTAPRNAIYAYCDSPFLKPGQSASYRVGMANLNQNVVGWQAFHSASAGQSIVDLGSAAPYYTSAPFTIYILDPRGILTFAGLSSGSIFGSAGSGSDAVLANVPYRVAEEAAVKLDIMPNNGATIPTRFSAFGGTGITPGILLGSDSVICDGTLPNCTITSATIDGADAATNPLHEGSLDVLVQSADAGAFPSGLAGRPTVVLDLSPIDSFGPEDINLATNSATGNQFHVSTTLPGTMPNGPARIVAKVSDRSGNQCEAVILTTVSNTVTISGNIFLQNFDADFATRTAIIEFSQSGVVMDSQIVALASNGDFTLETSLIGTYDISAKPSHWLKQRLDVVDTTGGVSNLNYSVINGDVDGDNEVNLVDFGLLSSAFGSVDGDPNWNAEADLDGDGEVNLVDFAILSQNFGLAGDE